MNIIQRAVEWIKIKVNAGVEAIGGNPFAIFAPTKNAQYTGWVYACVRAISEEVASTKFKIMKTKRDGSDEQVYGTELEGALEAVNERQTGYDLRFAISAHLELTGNSYTYLEGVTDALSKPTALYQLDPNKVKVVTTTGTFPRRLLHYKYTEGTEEFTFKPYEILHIKYPNPSDEIKGVGTVQSIQRWIDADEYADEVNARYFENGARIGGFLESDKGLTPAQLEYLKKSFDAVHRGAANAYKTAALPAGVKFTAGSTTPKDMDFVALGQEMGKRILAGFRVPKSVLGITEDVNRANAEATNYIFALRTIKPKMELITAYLNEFFVPRYGKDIYLTFENPVPENEAQKVEQMKAETGAQPILTPNEAREKYAGLDAVENGDQLYIGGALVPVGTPPGTVPQPVPAKAVAKTIKKARSKAPITMHRKNAEARQEMGEAFAEAAIKALAKVKENAEIAGKKKVSEMTQQDWNALQKALQERMKPYESALTEALQKHNKKQQSTVIANIGRATKGAKKVKAVNKNELFNLDAEISATIDLVTPELTKLYTTEGAKAGALLGVEGLDLLASDKLKKALAKGIDLMARSYNETTLDALKLVLEKGIEEGATMAQLTDLVASTYADWNDWRAQAVAQTEVFRVANSASKDAWKETGVVKTIKWHTSDDELTCEFCAPLNGEIISIDSNFFAKGDKLTGADGGELDLSYASVGSPPLHPNCRCTTAPEEISIED